MNDYTVKIDVKTPVTLVYRVKAKTPGEALSKIENFCWEKAQSQAPHFHWGKSLRLNATVLEYGTLKVELTKTYFK